MSPTPPSPLAAVPMVCGRCGNLSPAQPGFAGCRLCGGAVFVAHPIAVVRAAYRAHCAGGRVAATAIPALTEPVWLGEGHTPLRRAAAPGIGALWVKDETKNPTGAYKDRLNATAISVATAFGYDRVATSSTGNQAVSCAAYAAAAGLRCDAFLPDSAPDSAGWEIARYGGHAWIAPWDKRGPAVRALVEQGWAYVGRNAPRPLANPYGLEGYKTIAYEIVHDLGGHAPTAVAMPTCGGDGICGIWRGFVELHDAGIIDSRPRMIACQPAVSASIAAAFRGNLGEVPAIPLTASTALSLVDERGGEHGLRTVRESAGTAITLDEAALRTGPAAAAGLGIWADAAGAAALVAAPLLTEVLPAEALAEVVVVVTGTGRRWPDSLADVRGPVHPAEPASAALNDAGRPQPPQLAQSRAGAPKGRKTKP